MLLGKSTLSTAVAIFSLAVACSAQQLKLNDSLGTTYPYVVHLPEGAGQNMQNPPLHVFLPGMGSRGSASEAVLVSQWNGMGTLIQQYDAGNHSNASTIAAESWVVVIPVAPNDTTVAVPEYDIDVVKTIIEDVQAQYKTDPNRVYITGYSMGARAIWKFLVKYSSIVAAAAASSGEPNITTTDFQAFAHTPFRHYVGSADYDPSASLAVGTQVQAAVNQSGPTNTSLVVVQGPPVGSNGQPPHNQMSSAPFTADMLNWLLSNALSNDKSHTDNGTSTTTTKGKDGSSIRIEAKAGYMTISLFAWGLWLVHLI